MLINQRSAPPTTSLDDEIAAVLEAARAGRDEAWHGCTIVGKQMSGDARESLKRQVHQLLAEAQQRNAAT